MKDSRFEFRISSDLKKVVKSYCSYKNIKIADYITMLILEDITHGSLKSDDETVKAAFSPIISSSNKDFDNMFWKINDKEKECYCFDEAFEELIELINDEKSILKKFPKSVAVKKRYEKLLKIYNLLESEI